MKILNEQNYRSLIFSKYTTMLKSCRNLISAKDIQLIRQAFKIAIRNELNNSNSNYQAIIQILDTTLIVTQEIGLGRISIICTMLHKSVEKDLLSLEKVREIFGEKVWQIIKGLKEISYIYATRTISDSENFRKYYLVLPKIFEYNSYF